VRSARRTTVWHDNARLFRQAVVDAPLSYRAHYMFGSWLFEQKRKREAEVEYLAALKLFPYDPNIAFAFGEQYRASGMFAQAVPYYRWARAVDPNFFAGSAAFALCLLQLGRYADAKAEALRAVTHHGDARLLHRIAFLADSARAADSDRPPKVELVGSPSKVPHSMQKTSVGEGHPSERQSDKVLSKR